MKCALCKRPGAWSQRFGMILCNACKRRLERATLKLSSDPDSQRQAWYNKTYTSIQGERQLMIITLENGNTVVLDDVVKDPRAEAIKWLQQYKKARDTTQAHETQSEEKGTFDVTDCTTD